MRLIVNVALVVSKGAFNQGQLKATPEVSYEKLRTKRGFLYFDTTTHTHTQPYVEKSNIQIEILKLPRPPHTHNID